MNVTATAMPMYHTLYALLVISGIALVVAIGLLIASIAQRAYRKTHRGESKWDIPSVRQSIGILIFMTAVFGTCAGITAVGASHGMLQVDEWKKLPVHKVFDGIAHSEPQDSLPVDTHGAIIVLYKFGCPDCEAVHDELAERLADNEDVYWISSRSVEGQTLVQSYDVKEVPTVLYFYMEESEGNRPDVFQSVLYGHDSEGNAVLDEEAIERALELQAEGR